MSARKKPPRVTMRQRDSADPGEWRPVPGYEANYEVSSTGQVWSRPRPSTCGGVCAQQLNPQGYPLVTLSLNGRERPTGVHKLVTSAFLGPCPDGMEVRHLDGNPVNNDLSNLVYGTHAENMRDKIRHGTHQALRITHCPHGHIYDEANTYHDPVGARRCRTCMREQQRRRRARRAAA